MTEIKLPCGRSFAIDDAALLAALLGAVNEGIGVIEVQHVPPGIIRTRHIPGTEFWSRKDSE